MTRVSLTECYDDRSVIAKLKKMDEKLDANAGIVSRAEEEAKASAKAAQETADRFAGSVGVVVQDAKDEITKAEAEVTKAKKAVDATVTTVEQAVFRADTASASAQASALIVQAYEDRFQRAEAGIQTLDGETAELFAKDAMNLKSNEPNQTAQGLKVGTHDLTKAVTTDEAQTITGAKTHTNNLKVHKSGYNDHFTVSSDLVGAGENIGGVDFMDGTGTVRSRLVGRVDGSLLTDKNIPSGAPSNALVTKAYVESTDGTTNNLVHRTANESIEGVKTMGVPVLTRTASFVGTQAWRCVYVVGVNGGVTNNAVISFLGEDEYAQFMIHMRGGFAPSGEFLVKSSNWHVRIKLGRTSGNVFSVWVYSGRFQISIDRYKVANNAAVINPMILTDYETERADPSTSSDLVNVVEIV